MNRGNNFYLCFYFQKEYGLDFSSGSNESELSLRYSEMCSGNYFSNTQELFWASA